MEFHSRNYTQPQLTIRHYAMLLSSTHYLQSHWLYKTCGFNTNCVYNGPFTQEWHYFTLLLRIMTSRQYYTTFNKSTRLIHDKATSYLPSWSKRLQSAHDASNRSTMSTFLHSSQRTCKDGLWKTIFLFPSITINSEKLHC